MQARFTTAVLLGFVLAGVAACGGNDPIVADPGGSPLTYTDLSAGQIVPPGTYHFVGAPDALLDALGEVEQPADGYAPGTEIEIGGLGLRCTADSATNCYVTVHEDGSFTTAGTIATVMEGDTFPMTAVERQIAEANARAEAERMHAEAEKAKAEAAEQARQEAEQARQEAEEARQEEEAARQAAEAEAQRLANEAEERRKADALERARTAIAGHTATANPLTALAVGAIEYGEPAPVTNPQGPFTTSTGRSGSWSTTSLTANREPTRDMVEIYSDVETPDRDPFATSSHNEGANVGGPTGVTNVIDGEGNVVGWVNINTTAHSRLATSGSFPRDSGPPEPFTLDDRFHSEGEFDALTWDDGAGDNSGNGRLDADEEDILETEDVTRSKFLQYIAGSGFRDTKRFPERWAYETSGLLQGASGRYRCDNDTAPTTPVCTVQNNGGSFTFVGDWDFIPSNGTVRIEVPDAEYMWFGVWARQTVRLPTPPEQPTELWRFEANHGGSFVTTFTDATGPATYRGPAAGRYAVYEPDTGESGIGSFTASATLQADFDANTVSGMISGFNNDPSWSLDLKQADISSPDGTTGRFGVATNGVIWTIDGIPDESGAWEAAFYANLPNNGTITYQPHGIAGTFEAAYDPSGVGARAAVIGGFGAHR